MVKILLGCTGSVATIKLPVLINTLTKQLESSGHNIEIKVIVTECAKHFITSYDIPSEIEIYTDSSEWTAWNERGDPILHIDLGKWADIFLIAPLDANSMAKISNGICDNLLTCTARAWDLAKPLVFCPAMNTKMYHHPITICQINTLTTWGYHLVPVIEKTLVCGDTGLGAMAEVSTIVDFIQKLL